VPEAAVMWRRRWCQQICRQIRKQIRKQICAANAGTKAFEPRHPVWPGRQQTASLADFYGLFCFRRRLPAPISCAAANQLDATAGAAVASFGGKPQKVYLENFFSFIHSLVVPSAALIFAFGPSSKCFPKSGTNPGPSHGRWPASGFCTFCTHFPCRNIVHLPIQN
jgi:hypothetical protein